MASRPSDLGQVGLRREYPGLSADHFSACRPDLHRTQLDRLDLNGADPRPLREELGPPLRQLKSRGPGFDPGQVGPFDRQARRGWAALDEDPCPCRLDPTLADHLSRQLQSRRKEEVVQLRRRGLDLAVEPQREGSPADLPCGAADLGQCRAHPEALDHQPFCSDLACQVHPLNGGAAPLKVERSARGPHRQGEVEWALPRAAPRAHREAVERDSPPDPLVLVAHTALFNRHL